MDMEAELNPQAEEVLLPATSVTNGDAEVLDAVVEEYLEEDDPITDVAKSETDSPQKEISQKQSVNHEADEAAILEAEDAGEAGEAEEAEDEGEEEGEGEVEYILEENDLEEEDEVPVERKPTQVPKKRKDAAMLATAEDKNVAEGDDISNVEEKDEEEIPTSSKRAAAKQEDAVDEDQCRVCTTKEDLVSLFNKIDTLTVAEMLMTICPTISIAPKDFMPQYICNPCLDNVTIAVQLKTQCETTERELRKHLSRHKNKVRRPTGFVVIDAPVESDPPSDDDPADDVEFKVSDDSIASVDDDSEDSDYGSKKKRITRSSTARRGRRKSAVSTPAPKSKAKAKKSAARSGSLKRQFVVESSEEESISPTPTPKKKKKSISAGNVRKESLDELSVEQPTLFPCDECDKVFPRKLSLALHQKSHVTAARDPISCELCGKQFKLQGSYKTHLKKHEEEGYGHSCEKCDAQFTAKVDLRRHLMQDHGEKELVFDCEKCKRIFSSKKRLDRHTDGRCPGVVETKPKKNDLDNYVGGKELFKTVAPLTTTYWSDSFSD